MCLNSFVTLLLSILSIMKIKQAPALSDELTTQLREVGARLARLRVARRVRQEEAAIRAGLSRSTAVAIEKGLPRVAIGQIIRYLDAVAPGKSLTSLLSGVDPAELTLAASERRTRARPLAGAALKRLDF
jgi:transcriptional regulator with XRE-family HTH domain